MIRCDENLRKKLGCAKKTFDFISAAVKEFGDNEFNPDDFYDLLDCFDVSLKTAQKYIGYKIVRKDIHSDAYDEIVKEVVPMKEVLEIVNAWSTFYVEAYDCYYDDYHLGDGCKYTLENGQIIRNRIIHHDEKSDVYAVLQIKNL